MAETVPPSESLSQHVDRVKPSLAHPIPLPTLIGVFLALMVLTFVTVAATWIDLGDWNLWVAMAIATAKAALVALYFMHLRYDNAFNSLLLVTALLFVLLFIGLTLMDTLAYQPQVINRPTPATEAPE